MKLRLFDLHCDTPYELYKKRLPLDKNTLHVSLDGAAGFFQYAQVAAVWSDYRRTDEEVYFDFWRIAENFKNELQINSHRAALASTAGDIDTAIESKRAPFILSVEDARLLAGDITRLDALHKAGVRLLTLVWQGESCIGGAFDTDAPLTDFGRAALHRCFELGILPDISHASRPVTDEVIATAKERGKPVVASHSNAYDVCAHRRNLSSQSFTQLLELGGIVGISLAPQHLTDSQDCAIDNILPHIDYYLSLGGEKALCLGCDFDGIDNTPSGIDGIAHLYRLAEALARQNYSDTLIDSIFFTNAYNFFKRNMIQ
ncbi:MAG: hypothetical protein GX303_05105 [Clostridiales bacterium]|nr:hypothetical protein [Clostridiales bacterium]